MLKLSKQLLGLLAGACVFAVGTITFWVFDFWQIYANAKLLWPVFLGLFFLSILLWARTLLLETNAALDASKFSIEVNWVQSTQIIWHRRSEKDQKYYDLETTLRVRFNNGDSVAHTVRSARLSLRRRRHLWKPEEIGQSYYVELIARQPMNAVERFDSSGPGIRVQANDASEFMWFRFYTELPFGISSLTHHIAMAEFGMLGRTEKVIAMPVDCPRPFENIRYDCQGKPLVTGTTECRNETGEGDEVGRAGEDKAT
jgi:hypothetical protein